MPEITAHPVQLPQPSGSHASVHAIGPWTRLSRHTVYEGPFYRVDEDAVIRPDGSNGTYSVVHKGPFVIIIAVEAGRPYFVRQFRYATEQEGWEVIKGGCDGQPIHVAAERELREEAGLAARNWVEIGAIESASSYLDEIGHIMLATDLTVIGGSEQEVEGITACQTFSRDEYIAKILSGDIHDAQTIAALHLAELQGFVR